MDSQDLNLSRFLIEEINLDEQPTEEEVMDRARELDIDDLYLARESLTKQLQPEWKPYCNRYGDIYYINLVEGKAYIDHPIDMHYKKLYSTIHRMPSPRFQSLKLTEISQSVHLIQKEMRNFTSQSSTLRIVYEQPSQEQQLSSQARSPSHMNIDDPLQPEEPNISDNGMTQQMRAELMQYEAELEQRFQNQLQDHKKKLMDSLAQKQKQQKARIERHICQRIAEVCDTYRHEVQQKNELDLQKQKCKIQEEYQNKINAYAQNIHKFNEIFDQLRMRQRNVDSMRREIQLLNKVSVGQQYETQKQLALVKSLEGLRRKMSSQFNEKIGSIVGGLHILQDILKKQLNDLFDGRSPVDTDTERIKKTEESHDQLQPIRKNSSYSRKRQIFQKSPPKISAGQNVANQAFYRDLEQEIKCENVYGRTPNYGLLGNGGVSSWAGGRAGLNLRLRMRIV